MKFVPLTKEYSKVNHSWRGEAQASLYNPHQNLSVDELWALNEKDGFDVGNLSTHSTYRQLAIVNGVPIGNVSLKNINFTMLTAEIGYTVGEKYHRKGYGTLMVSKFLEELFQKSELRKIVAYVHADNIASQKLLERLGFVKEGLLRAHFVINGKPCDEILYGLLKKEFIPKL